MHMSLTPYSHASIQMSLRQQETCQREIGVGIYVWIDAWDMWWHVMTCHEMWWHVMCHETYVDLDHMSPRDSCLNLPMDWRMRQLMYDTSHLRRLISYRRISHTMRNAWIFMKTHTTWESNSVIARTTTINLYAHSYKPRLRLSAIRQTTQLPDIWCMKCRVCVHLPKLHGRCIILLSIFSSSCSIIHILIDICLLLHAMN